MTKTNHNESNDGIEPRKASPGAMSITRLVKMNLLEEDNVEDIHFSFVALNSHKLKILQNKDWKGLIKHRIKKSPFIAKQNTELERNKKGVNSVANASTKIS